MPQTSYSLIPAAGRAGCKANASQGDHVDGAICDGAVQAGILGQFADVQNVGTDINPGEFKPLAALAVDVDAIVTTLASVASITTLSGAGLTGVVGAAEMVPARRITVILDSHANWDAGTWYLTGRDVNGELRQEALVVADAGAATYTSKHFYSKVESILIPAQASTGGSMTVGITADEGEFSTSNFGIALRPPSGEPLTSGDLFEDGDTVDVLRKGSVYAVSEAATAKGDLVYVRCVESGADMRGQFSNAAGANFGLLHGAYWAVGCALDGIGVIALK